MTHTSTEPHPLEAGPPAVAGRPEQARPTSASARAGYLGAAFVNVAMAWVANHLLGWGWPPFLTDAFEDLLPWVNASLVASIVVNLAWTARDPLWLKHLGQLALDAIGLVVIVRSWQLFPFDLSGHWSGWEVLARALHVVAFVGVVIDTGTRVAGLGQIVSKGAQMPEERSTPRLPPRWFIRRFWFAHRRLYRLTGGRLGLWRPKPDGWGALRLTTVGRRTGLERSVMVGYFEDGPDLVSMAMNGGGEAEPAWWLNLQAQPKARVDTRDGPRLVTARAAHGEERARLWSRGREIDRDLDACASRRPTETAVVVLERRS